MGVNSETWVDGYCGRYGNELYLRIPRSFITDPVVAASLHSLMDRSAIYEDALRLVSELPSSLDESSPEHRRVIEELYGALHVRFATSTGLADLREMVERGAFGTCPRVLCREQTLMPLGLDDSPGKGAIKGYCPVCGDVYHLSSRYKHVDGAAFGTSLPHLLILKYPEMALGKSKAMYLPRIFGFKVGRRRSAEGDL